MDFSLGAEQEQIRDAITRAVEGAPVEQQLREAQVI